MKPTKLKRQEGLVKDLVWLGDVQEIRHPISLSMPLWARQLYYEKDSGPLPRPTLSSPEQHPHCELNITLEGKGIQYIGTEKIERSPIDIVLIGPGTPHYGFITSLPLRQIAVYFSPIFLLELAPKSDGARALARFTLPRTIQDRVVRPPKQVGARIAGHLENLLEEFENPRPFSEFQTRALLLEALAELFRWEESTSRVFEQAAPIVNWPQLEASLHFLHEHYAEPIYVEDLSKAVGLSVSRLQAMFRDAFGMSCVQYLRAYRISNATARLCLPDARVTEVAFSVGFETLSHFNTTFRTLMGMSPTEFIHSVGNRKKK